MSKRAYHNLAQVLFILGFLFLALSFLMMGDKNIYLGIGCVSLILTGLLMTYLGSRHPDR